MPIDDSWSRDAGPCFLVHPDGGRLGVDFQFNAWGGKYSPYDHDNAFAAAVIAKAGVPRSASRLTAEGGGISTDGQGTILTTLSCFPNRNRNPDWTLQEIERELMDQLGADKVVWLPGDEEEVETDGHVDGIAVFAAPGLVLATTARTRWPRPATRGAVSSGFWRCRTRSRLTTGGSASAPAT
ncbi:MAG: agmatine deiminase family protein [Limibacillus sp.]